MKQRINDRLDHYFPYRVYTYYNQNNNLPNIDYNEYAFMHRFAYLIKKLARDIKECLPIRIPQDD